MEISENGPLLQNADNNLNNAMNNCWKQMRENGAWHFIRKQGELYFNQRSRVIDKLMKKNLCLLLWKNNKIN